MDQGIEQQGKEMDSYTYEVLARGVSRRSFLSNAKPRNPHENRHYGTEADCNLCHHQHKKSENFCLPCHQRFDFVVP
jgi:hypothetical protein